MDQPSDSRCCSPRRFEASSIYARARACPVEEQPASDVDRLRIVGREIVVETVEKSPSILASHLGVFLPAGRAGRSLCEADRTCGGLRSSAESHELWGKMTCDTRGR